MGFHQPCLRKRNQLVYFILLCVAAFIMFKMAERYLKEANQNLNPTGKLGSTVTQLRRWIQSITHKAPTKVATSFIAVKTTKTLLVSAYLEHRTNPRQVRVIAVVLREETVAYRCVLLCRNNQTHVSDGDLQIHNDHFGFRYGTADILCVIPSSCDTPSHVAVASAAFKEEYRHEFLEVKNENKKTESFNHTFTVCLSTMFDFNNVLQFVQSLEMFRLLGVSKVFVYKTSCSSKTQSVLNYYTRKGIIEVIPWSMSGFLNVSRGWLPSHGPGDLHYFGQIAALNDCLYRNMYRSKYVALHDVDELILPQTVKTWTELLPLLESKYNRNKCYMFENNVFPNNMTLPRSGTDPARWRGVPGVDVLAHLHQEPVTKEHVYEKFKIIVNPRLVIAVSVHGVLKSHSLNGCVWVDRNIARMYHTRAQMQVSLTSEQLVYDGRLLNYSETLIKAVNVTLSESGIL
ncbi:beta-1,4-galactosyltransferase galt-1-like isoform X1 [Xiphophorus couchianus]|uniref:beta-1,4-galactosyltransferase galt-1-like isoform X1 n=1 Tax=Xiphophorus couchianus TaxID=32473 RepID=UPI001016D3AE|nr:beta-1,4-galactosyltransferase galt-1-like isoform X1 [Xiphophorus couchianus]XP_027855134.1 beta-1,4-galactosyltransferase galt-1-like isoform X1 [Xiphophorus couchianus]XP_027855135.1 beta-1,4-galactosyltransferase galt-1-like isoform X1 [Xiphophorus couchianus]